MIRKLSPILAAVVTSMLVGGLAWAAAGDPTPPSVPSTSVADAPIVGTFTFGAGEAGSVTLTSDGSNLVIDSIDANPGWTVEVQVAVGREVEVSFRTTDNRIDFNAELEDGELRIRVRDRAAGSEEETVVTSTPAGDGSSTTLPDTSIPDDSVPDTSVPDDTAPTIPDTTVTTVEDTIPDTTPTTIDDNDDTTPTTIDDNGTTSTTIDDNDDNDDTTSTTIDDNDGTTSTTIDDDGTTSTTIDDNDDTTSTTIDDNDDDSSAIADGTYTFPVANAGSVTVTVSGSVLRLASVSANDGWHATVEKDEPDRVRVEFDNGDDDVEIDIRLDDGKFEVEVD